MRSPLLAVPALALLVACVRPEVEAFRQAPAPIAVAFEVPADVQGRTDISKEYAAAIRARLATRATVIPEGVQGPANAATLRVTITDVREGRRSGDPSPVAVGVTTGVVVGTLNALAGNRNAGFEGFQLGAGFCQHLRLNIEFFAGNQIKAGKTLGHEGFDIFFDVFGRRVFQYLIQFALEIVKEIGFIHDFT